MGSEDQALTTHTKKTKRDHHHSKGKPYHSRRDWDTIRCYTCDEKGHISKFYPNKGNSKKKKENKRRHHAHAAEDDEIMNLTQRELDKKVILQVMKNMY